MENRLNIGRSALDVYSAGIGIAAHNIANINTKDFNPQRVHYADVSKNRGITLNWISESKSDVDLSQEIVDLIITQNSYEANCITIRVADDMIGTILNTKV